MSEEQKKDGLFNPPKTEGNSTVSFQEQNLIKSIVSLVKHEVNIAIDEKTDDITSKVDRASDRIDDLENDMITSESFGDAFRDEIYNEDIASKDDLNDVIADKFDQLLDELKITRN